MNPGEKIIRRVPRRITHIGIIKSGEKTGQKPVMALNARA
jgi:hypothetical protein